MRRKRILTVLTLLQMYMILMLIMPKNTSSETITIEHEKSITKLKAYAPSLYKSEFSNYENGTQLSIKTAHSQASFIPKDNETKISYPLYPWPMLGHDNQRTGYVEGPAPNTSELLWQTEYLPVYGPITVSDGRVFITGPAEKWLYRIYCLNESDGQILWNKVHPRRVGSWPIYFFPSLTIFNGRIFHSKGAGIDCFDEFSGSMLWSHPNPEASFSDSPVVEGDRVFVTLKNLDGEVLALNVSNGEILWKSTIKNLGGWDGWVSSPTVTDKAVIVCCYNYTSNLCIVYSYDKETGSVIWSRYFSDIPSPIYRKYLYVPAANGKVFLWTNPNVYALNQTTGQKIWNYSIGRVTVSPVIAYGKIFVVSYASDDQVYVYSLNETAGNLVWKYGPLANAVFCSSCVAVADGKIYLATGNPAFLYCLNETNGELIWSYKLGHWAHGLCVADGNLFVSANGRVYAFGKYVVTTQSSISLKIDPSPMIYELPINISGSINPARNGTVYIQWSVEKEVWYSIIVTAVNGMYHYSWIPPCNGTIYVRAFWEGDEVYSGAISSTETIIIPDPILSVNTFKNDIPVSSNITLFDKDKVMIETVSNVSSYDWILPSEEYYIQASIVYNGYAYSSDQIKLYLMKCTKLAINFLFGNLTILCVDVENLPLENCTVIFTRDDEERILYSDNLGLTTLEAYYGNWTIKIYWMNVPVGEANLIMDKPEIRLNIQCNVGDFTVIVVDQYGNLIKANFTLINATYGLSFTGYLDGTMENFTFNKIPLINYTLTIGDDFERQTYTMDASQRRDVQIMVLTPSKPFIETPIGMATISGGVIGAIIVTIIVLKRRKL